MKTIIKNSSLFLCGLLLLGLFTACSEEVQNTAPLKAQYGVSFEVEGYTNTKTRIANKENEIKHLYVVVFKKSEENYSFKKLYEVYENDGVFSFDLYEEGTFQLFFVANPEAKLVSELSEVKTTDDLKNIMITQAPLSELNLFLMDSGETTYEVTTQKNQIVKPSESPIKLYRLASKFDFYNEKSNFVPQKIIFKNQVTNSRFIKTTADDEALKASLKDITADIKEASSPLITFYTYENPFTNLDQKISFVIHGELDGEKVIKEITLQNSTTGKNEFLVKRNHRYKITITDTDEFLKDETRLEFKVDVEDWKEEEIRFIPKEIIRKTQPENTRAGININEQDQSVTFVLYDRDNQGNHWDNAHLIGNFNNWQLQHSYQMYRDDVSGCWWYTLSNIDQEKEYSFQYHLWKGEETLRLADAYSEKILDPCNDKYIPASTYPGLTYPKETNGIVSVFQAHKPEYTWQITDFKIDDPNNLIIYELLLRDFTSTGDINGALEKLPYLKSLGINAIELMPVQEFDGNDSWGYNPCFFFALDKAYGTLNDYKKFVDACHKEGIAVILDVVYNHATGAHPFARLYWDGTKNQTASNNPWFNAENPHHYQFFHDFNHEQSMVREFIKRNLAFLLNEYKFDGIRFDFSKGFTQTPGEAKEENAQRIQTLIEYNKAIKAANPNAVVILEHFCVDGEEIWLANEGMKLWRNVSEPYYQSAMGYAEKSSFSQLYHKSTPYMPFGVYVSYMESHDEERAAFKQLKYGNWDLNTNLSARMKRLGTNAAFCFTVPGSKMLWQFGELGYDFAIEFNGRTGRKPIRWEYMDVAERYNLYTTYSKLINFRTQNPELFTSEAEFTWHIEPQDWDWNNDNKGRLIKIKKGEKEVVIVGNFMNTNVTAHSQFTSTGNWYNMIDNEIITVSSTNQSIEIPPHEFKAYVNFDPTKNESID